MTRPRFVQVWLGEDHVGYLSEVGSIYRFVPADSYVGNENRPTLSLCFSIPSDNKISLAILNDPRNMVNVGEGTLPPYFANLLPEGALRSWLAKQRRVDEDYDFEILAAAGSDLPGAITIRPAPTDSLPAHIRTRLITADAESVGLGMVDAPIEGAWSLAGAQPKLALSLIEKGKRYTLRTKHNEADIIAKLPYKMRPDMVRNEFASMSLAKEAGVNTAEFWLDEVAALDVPGLDRQFPDNEPFLAVKRFDRTPHGRIHTEDFCQILARPPRKKYAKESEYVKAVQLLDRLSPNSEDVREFIRRQVVNTLLGNTDAHLKNFSVLYEDRRFPTLTPAYDIVCVAAYLGGGEFALNENIDDILQRQTMGTYETFAKAAGLSTKIVKTVVIQTVDRCQEKWPKLLQKLPASDVIHEKIIARLKSLPLAQLKK